MLAIRAERILLMVHHEATEQIVWFDWTNRLIKSTSFVQVIYSFA